MDMEISSESRRFEFGANWWRFLQHLDETRILEAEASLRSMLGVSTLQGRAFLDAGSGSGLFSLAARRLGAKVHSFDYDARSVACTAELKRRYFASDESWVVEQGSVIDRAYMEKLGEYDIVYSWGVLHHTGAMWLALEFVMQRVSARGTLFVAIYNDQQWKSRLWWLIKWLYIKIPSFLRTPYVVLFGGLGLFLNILRYTLKGRPMAAISPLMNYRARRGMHPYRDLVDWIGGFPFEFAGHDLLVAFLNARKFEAVNSICASSLGCHQVVARRITADETTSTLP